MSRKKNTVTGEGFETGRHPSRRKECTKGNALVRVRSPAPPSSAESEREVARALSLGNKKERERKHRSLGGTRRAPASKLGKEGRALHATV